MVGGGEGGILKGKFHITTHEAHKIFYPHFMKKFQHLATIIISHFFAIQLKFQIIILCFTTNAIMLIIVLKMVWRGDPSAPLPSSASKPDYC